MSYGFFVVKIFIGFERTGCRAEILTVTVLFCRCRCQIDFGIALILSWRLWFMLMLGTRLVCLDMEGGWIWHQLFNIQFFLPSQQPSIKWGGKKKRSGVFLQHVERQKIPGGDREGEHRARVKARAIHFRMLSQNWKKEIKKRNSKNKWQSQIIAHFKFKRKLFTRGGS